MVQEIRKAVRDHHHVRFVRFLTCFCDLVLGCFAAARALRGANTRTNFVPAMACEGTTVPASKAARLIRLRQLAAQSKAGEKEAARNAAAPRVESQKGADPPNLKVEPHVNDSPAVVRQDLQQSISSLDPLPSPTAPAPAPAPAIVDDHTPHLPPPPSSPPKPPRLIGRRQIMPPPLASPKPEQEDDDPPFAAIHDYGTVDNRSPCIKLEVVDPPSPPKLEPQQSITSENLSNAINHSLVAGSPQDSCSPPLSFPSPRSPFDRVQANSVMADGAVPLVNSFVEVADHLKSFHKEKNLPQRPPPMEPSFSPFTVDNFVAPPPIPFHALEPSRQLIFRPDHQTIISGLVAFSHHQLSSCATNRDLVSMYPTSEKDEVICSGRGVRSAMGTPMSIDTQKCVTTESEKACEARVSTVRCKEEMDYTSSEMYRMEAERKNIDRFILREKEFAELNVPDIPWPDYVLMDETGMNSGLLGLDLSCENSGVYNSAFDFSAEAIDRDSCTSVMLEHEHLSDDSEFLLRMQYEQSNNSPAENFRQECVLLTQPRELDYGMSPHESSLPGPPLSPQETHSLSISSSLLWRLDDASACWDGQSSGSTETTDLKPNSGDGGECTSQDHEALWSSMDLTPLCMVA